VKNRHLSLDRVDELFVKNSLKPAKIDGVKLSDDEKTAYVWLDEDQRSIAIGKGGQNIALAARITGVNIQLMREDEFKNAENISIQEQE